MSRSTSRQSNRHAEQAQTPSAPAPLERDNSRSFVPLNLAILTVCDDEALAPDAAGDLLRDRVRASGHLLVARDRVAQELALIRARVTDWVGDEAIDVVLLSGGIGLTGRDVTPEALQPLVSKPIDGFGEQVRQLYWQRFGPAALHCRALAAVAGATYRVALPASPEVCRAAWDTVLAPQLDNRTQPHNLVETLPQLTETRPPSARLLPKRPRQELDEVDPQDAARFRLR